MSDGIINCFVHLSYGLGIQVENPGDDEIENNKGGGHKDQESEPGVFPNPQNIQAGHAPDDEQHGDDQSRFGNREEGGGVGHRTHRGDAGGEDIVHHDGGHRHEGDQRAQDQVGKGVDPAADELVMLQDFGDLREPGADEAHQQAGDGDKDDGAQADEAVRFGGDVKDGGELIHQGDDALPPDR